MNAFPALLAFLLFCLSPVTEAMATETLRRIPMAGILASAEKDASLSRLKALEACVASAPSSTPWLDRVEIRTRLEDMDDKKQQYALRFSPRGWGETEAGLRLKHMKAASVGLSRARRYGATLKARYDLILDSLETETRMEFEKALRVHLEDEIRILETLGSGDPDFRVTDLLAVQEAHTARHLEIIRLENRLSGLAAAIGVLTGGESALVLETEPLISPEVVAERLLHLPEALAADSPVLAAGRQRVDLAREHYALEVAKSRDYLSFVELSYDTDASGDAERAVGLELGLRLPFVNRDREVVQERMQDWMEESRQYEETLREGMEKVTALRSGLKRLLEQHALLSGRESGRIAASLEICRRMDGGNPMDTLKIREAMIRNGMGMAEIRFGILRRYIDLLDLQGQLAAEPRINHLAASGEALP